MKIIVPGKDLDTKVFTCTSCGCVFEATKGEYHLTHGDYYETFNVCNCPNCNALVREDKEHKTI